MSARYLSAVILFTTAAAVHSAEIPAVPLEAESPDPALAKIVLVAGPKIQKTPAGAHEYAAGCRVLHHLLSQTPGVFPVLVADGWPKKPETFAGAKTVVFFGDGGGVQPMLKGDHLAQVQKLADAGVGLVNFHQNVDYPKDLGDRARGWLGGCYEPKFSLRAHWVAAFDKFPDHPVCRGVTPFTVDDGWLTKSRFVPDMKGVTPILRTRSPKDAVKVGASTDDIVCWAYDRPAGGRGFAFTGGHLHESWKEPGYRRLLVNGVLWSAGVDVPKDGAKADLDQADLPKFLGQ